MPTRTTNALEIEKAEAALTAATEATLNAPREASVDEMVRLSKVMMAAHEALSVAKIPLEVAVAETYGKFGKGRAEPENPKARVLLAFVMLVEAGYFDQPWYAVLSHHLTLNLDLGAGA